MAQSNSYPRDPVIKDKDVFSGTQFATLRTVNFTAQAVADYLNINGKISIGGQMTFKFVTLTPGNGTISFPLGGGDNTPFSAITNLVVSTTDMSTQNVVNFLNYIVGSEILLTEQSHISTFGNYKITGYAITANPNFYDLTLEYVGGFGNITQDLYYDLTFFRTEGSTPPVIPTKTSDLINDGEDGIHPFITAQDIPDALIFTSPLVDTAGTITINQSGLSSDGYLSSIDWNTFNDKQDALLGTGFVKSTAGVISYDTNTYYLASNPDGFITSAALTGYVPYTGATQAVNLGAYNLTVNNISVGKGSGTGTGNTAVGGNALLNNTTGEYNSAFGSASAISNTTGSSNTSVGALSLQLNTTGNGNSAIGRNSLSKNTTGNSNTAVGTSSLNNNTTGAVNVAIGSDSLFNNTTGFYNSTLGVSSLVGNTTGSNNSAFGYEAGRYIADKATSATILNNSLMLGWRTSPLANNQTNQIVIGYDAIGAGSNTVVLGNSSIVTTVLRGNVGINTTTPISRLHISGPQATIRIDDTNSMDTLNSFQMVCRDYDDIQQMRFGFSTPLGAGAKTIMTLDQTGNVGINTTIPEQELHVVGNARVTGAIYDSNNEPGIMGQVLSSTVTGTDWVDIVDTGLTSVGLTMPVAFSVANSPLTSNGTIDVTAAGLSSQYIRGDGQLATFPTSGGGGSSVTYYLNGSIPSSVAGYQQMDNDAVIGLGTDFSLTGNGLIAQFLTDAGNPNRIEIPGGAWNFEMFFNISSVGGNTKFYIDLLKYDGTTFTLISSGSTNPEEITGGTSVDLYLTSLAVPTTPLLITDRLAIRVYIVDNSGGRTATLHTEDNNLCEIITTFSSGVASLNGLTASTQYFAVGTSGMDFNISSLVDTHTFNLPTASAVNRGALSSADWITFNSKFNLPSLTSGSVLFSNGTTIVQDNANFFWDDTNNRLGIGTATPNYPLHVKGDILIEGASGSETIWMSGGSAVRYSGGKLILQNSIYIDSGNGNVGIGTTSPTEKLVVGGSSGAMSTPTAIRMDDTYRTGGDSFNNLKFYLYKSTNETYGFGLGDLADLQYWAGTTSTGTHKFFTSQTERMRITSAGNVGIGTTSPATALDVNGVITATGGNSTSWNAKENPLTFSSPLVRTVNTVSIPKASGGVNGYLSSIDWLVFNGKQDAITLTTTGTSGAATLVGSTLNIPQYSGGGSSVSGIHSFVKPESGRSTGALIIPSLTVTASTASRLIVYPYIPAQSITCSSLYIVITALVAGSNTRILIYSSLNGLPNTKLYESANLDSSTNGGKTATTTQTFNAGTTYWIGVHTSANQSMSAISLAGTLNISLSGASASNAVYITPSFGSAPTTFGAPTYFSGNVQLVGITI